MAGRKGGIVKKIRKGGRQKRWQGENVAARKGGIMKKECARIRGRQKRWQAEKVAL